MKHQVYVSLQPRSTAALKKHRLRSPAQLTHTCCQVVMLSMGGISLQRKWDAPEYEVRAKGAQWEPRKVFVIDVYANVQFA